MARHSQWTCSRNCIIWRLMSWRRIFFSVNKPGHFIRTDSFRCHCGLQCCYVLRSRSVRIMLHASQNVIIFIHSTDSSFLEFSFLVVCGPTPSALSSVSGWSDDPHFVADDSVTEELLVLNCTTQTIYVNSEQHQGVIFVISRNCVLYFSFTLTLTQCFWFEDKRLHFQKLNEIWEQWLTLRPHLHVNNVWIIIHILVMHKCKIAAQYFQTCFHPERKL